MPRTSRIRGARLQRLLQHPDVLSSEDQEAFRQRFRAGEMGNAMDVVEWGVFYEMWESVWARLALLEAAESPWSLGRTSLKS